MKENTIGIIGGAGFLGRNMIEKLDKSNSITVFDVGVRPEFLPESIVYHDLGKHKIDNIKDCQFELIYHFAGNSSVGHSVKDPIMDVERSVVPLLEILEFAKNNCKKFIFSSSAACYGEMLDQSTRYQDNPISPYGISKKMSELYIKYYSNNSHLNVEIYRFFSLFGKYNRKQVVYDTVVRLLENPSELVVYNPNSTRDFIFVDDAIKIICNYNPGTNPTDIGTGTSTSILSLTKLICQVLNCDPKITTIQNKFVGDPIMQIADVSQIEADGFIFENHSLVKNIVTTIDWIIKERK
jgi:UDP-glucose 4-epimerase